MITIKFNKELIIALIIGVFIGAGIMFLIDKQDIRNERKAQEIISAEEAGEKILNIVNQHMLPPEITASLIGVVSERGLYRVTINIQEEEINVYITKDGALLFPEAIDLAALLAAPIEEQPEFTQEQLAGLAKCLTEKGVIFYGTHWCGACDRQKEMFGAAAQYLPYIECSEDQATEQELAKCQEAGVTSIPDWRFPDDRQEVRILSIEQLAELSGCPL